MSIIEEYKRKAHSIVAEAKAKLTLEQESSPNNHQQKQLIQEILEKPSNVGEQTDYEAQQFDYFANLTQTKEAKCRVCGRKSPKYTCPKCKVRYCSIDHYKTHNLFCTEKFFKQQVQQQLKATRAPKQQKKKMIESLKQHHEELAGDEDQIYQEMKVEEISEKRLLEISQLLEDGKKVNLTESELKSFEAYLKEIQHASLHQSTSKSLDKQERQEKPFIEYQPYWMIQQGLSQYWNMQQTPSFEEYQQSEHQQIINYRQLASQLLREELYKMQQIINVNKASVFVNMDLIQVVYEASLLFRCYSGEYLNNIEFIETLVSIYDSQFAKKVAFSRPKEQTLDLLSTDIHVVSMIKTYIGSKDKIPSNVQEMMQSWMPYAIYDSKTILSNKYLCLQTLFRLLEGLRSISGQEIQWKDQIMNKKLEDGSKKLNKKQKEFHKEVLKLIKKLQYLIVFCNKVVYSSRVDNEDESLSEIMQFDNLKLIKEMLERQGQQEQERSDEVRRLNEIRDKEKEAKLKGILLPNF